MIPKIIHQIWRTDAPPLVWRDHVLSWRRQHPDWRHRIWSDAECRSLVDRQHHALRALYHAYPYDIQRADFMRYLILFAFGGVYADLDVECLRPIDRLTAGRRLLIASEPAEHAAEFGRETMLSNAVMAAVPGHAFLGHVLRHLAERARPVTYHHEVLTTTGPLMLSDLFREASRRDVSVLEPHVFNPFPNGSEELRRLARSMPDAARIRQRALDEGSYGIHYWSNSWVRNLAGPLHNPAPFEIAGYRFHPAMDSPGCDIGNAGRDIRRLARIASERPDVAGFNTDGFMKWRIRPWWQWVTMGNVTRGEGLYVKSAPGPLGWLRRIRARH